MIELNVIVDGLRSYALESYVTGCRIMAVLLSNPVPPYFERSKVRFSTASKPSLSYSGSPSSLASRNAGNRA